MKSKPAFALGLSVGVLVTALVLCRYSVSVSTWDVPIVVKVNRWTGEVETQFAVPGLKKEKHANKLAGSPDAGTGN
jgi:hypothetical protein